jgi:uncharacterized protein YcbK (DUF882 family)
MHGKATDIAIPGIGVHKIRQTALAHAAGAVGYYRQIGSGTSIRAPSAPGGAVHCR